MSTLCGSVKRSLVKPFRTFIQFDSYEAKLLRRLKRDLDAQARARGELSQGMQGLIRGCVRTAIHMVYGDPMVYNELLDKEEFRRLCQRMEIDLSHDSKDGEDDE